MFDQFKKLNVSNYESCQSTLIIRFFFSFFLLIDEAVQDMIAYEEMIGHLV